MSKPIKKILKAKTEHDRNNMSNVIIQSFIKGGYFMYALLLNYGLI